MATWRMAFRNGTNGPSFWPQCKQSGVAAITYRQVADVDFSRHATDEPTSGWDALQPVEKGCLRHFIDGITVGDIIYVKEGPLIVGKGVVTGPYEFDAAGPIFVPNGECAYHHQRRVNWSPEFQPLKIQVGHPPIQTLLKLGPADVTAVEEARGMEVDRERVLFLRGLLAAFASNAQLLNYDEVRRLSRLSDEQMGTYLDEARKGRAEGEPDLCAIVVKTAGKPGPGWGDAAAWAAEVQRAHRFWADRRLLDNEAFEERYGRLPAIPGLPSERPANPA